MKKLTPRQIVDIVKKKKWMIQGFNGYPLYLHCVASNTGWMGKQVVGANYSHFFYRVHDSELKMYYDEKDLVAIGEAYYKHIRNVRELNALCKKHKDQYLFFRRKTGDYSVHTLQDLSLKELVTIAESHMNELTMTIGFAHVIEGISWVSERRLDRFLEKRGAQSKKDAQLLSSPTEPSFILRAQIMLGAVKKSSGQQRRKLIERFIRDYGWLDSSFVEGDTLDAAEVWQKAKAIEHQSSLRVLAIAQRMKSKRMKELRLRPDEVFVVNTIELCTIWQDNRKELILQTIARFEPVIKELSRRLGVSAGAFKYLCPKEVTIKNLSNQKFLRDLQQRYPRCDYYVARDQFFIYSGNEYQQIEQSLGNDNDQRVDQLHGTIANQGKVTGVVKICQTIHDIAKVKQGEVLVAFMTRPEFLPAMQKAAAFVTNEGGITSHAAIVAREMNKPCIIGTKIATDVFHDGDLVEVNANHGVVTVIKRA